MRALRWMWKDLWTTFRWELVAASSCRYLGEMLQLGAAAGALGLVRSLEAPDGLWLDPLLAIPVLGGILVSLLLAASALLYVARARITSIMQRYDQGLTRRMIVLSRNLVDHDDPAARDLLAGDRLPALMRSATRRTARVAGKWVEALPTIAHSLGLFAFLCWLHPTFTLALVGLFAVATVWVASSHRAVADASLLTERRAETAGKARRAIVRSPADAEADAEEIPDANAGGAAIAAEIEAFFSGLLARDRATLGTDVLLAVVLPVVFVVGGSGAVSGLWTWSGLLIYLVAARTFVGNVTSLARSFYSTSRDLRHIDRIATFIARASTVLERARHPVVGNPVVDAPS